jgi:hypothetical protein
MSAPNLATAFLAALARKRPSPVKPAVSVPATGATGADILLNALRNSATGRDQIMQRRIGLFPDDSS